MDVLGVQHIRTQTSDMGTRGTLYIPRVGFTCKMLELPWRDNRPNLSCIPAGEYECRFVHSPKYGPIYQIMNVPGRTHVLMHWGNVAGDKLLNYRTHSAGCQLLGRYHGVHQGQWFLSHSRTTVREFHHVTKGVPLILNIQENY